MGVKIEKNLLFAETTIVFLTGKYTVKILWEITAREGSVYKIVLRWLKLQRGILSQLRTEIMSNEKWKIYCAVKSNASPWLARERKVIKQGCKY